MDGIYEREAELDAIAALLEDARRGDGGLLVFEGPAGIGKTALLREAGDLASGFRVLGATAAPLDAERPFGLVHALFGDVLRAADAAWRERLLAGAAGRAAALLLEGSAEAPTGSSAGLLHALYWLCANVAEQEPLLLVVDDLQWADALSLRFLGFLSRRLDGLTVAVLAGTRPRGDAPLEVLGTIRRLTPLSTAAATRLLASALGASPDAAFVGACQSATGGNPLLLRELARTAAERDLRGAAAESDAVLQLGSAGVTPAVEQRLSLLGPAAVALARATAIFGDDGRISDLAAVAAVTEREAADAAADLGRAGVLEAGTHRFVHPLVREAVLAGTGPEERALLHSRSAAQLKARGAWPAEIAVHLLHTPPAGVNGTVYALRTAARDAVADGALDVAVAYLARALAEPPPEDRRGPLLLELGEVEADHGVADASERLTAALSSGQLTPDEAARGLAARARQLMLRDPLRAADDLETAVATAEDADVRLRVQSLLFDVTAYVPDLDGRRPALLESDPSPVVLAHRAVDAAYRSAPASSVTALASRALAGGELLRVVGPQATYHLLAMALRHAEQPALADTTLRAGEAEVRRLGSRFAMYFMDHARAYWELMYGSVTAAEAHARSSLAITREAALPMGQIALVAMLSEVLIERDQLDEADAHMAAVALPPALERMISGSDLISARAELHRLRGRLDAAEADARRARELVRARGWTAPLKSLAGLRLAETLIDAGRPDEAAAVLAEEEAVARGAGTPGTLGMILRVRGRIDGDFDEALALLERSSMRLELARAWLTSGSAQRALDEATRIGATRIARLAVEAGAVPPEDVVALTPDERRVAGLAADGLGDREIAEALWVTQRAVEQLVASASAKLGVASRDLLAGALQLSAGGRDAPRRTAPGHDAPGRAGGAAGSSGVEAKA